MSLRVRLEGDFEALEQMLGNSEVLHGRLSGGWRAKVSDHPQDLAAQLVALPAVLKRVAAKRLPSDERKQVDKLIQRTLRALQRLELRVDAMLLASVAEMSTSLDRKLLRLAELARPFELRPGERVLGECRGALRRLVSGRWSIGPAKIPGELRSPAGLVRLTQLRLLYEDRARKHDLPVEALELRREANDRVTMRCRDDDFSAKVPRLLDLMLRVLLMRRFPTNLSGEEVPYAVAPARRDAGKGWLLAWPGGVVFAPDRHGTELLALLAPGQLSDFPLPVIGVEPRAVLEALASLLPWAADAALHQIGRSSYPWSLRRDELTVEDHGATAVIADDSGAIRFELEARALGDVLARLR